MELPYYPRTKHVEGSRCQAGQVDEQAVSFDELMNQFIVVEEKVDGSHVGLGFDEHVNLVVFSRNTILDRSHDQRLFGPLFRWLDQHMDALWDVLTTRYVLYGEWAYAKHTVFYDQLPDFLLEDDVFDREQQAFLDTAERRRLLPEWVSSVPILYEGQMTRLSELTSLLGPSQLRTSSWPENLANYCKLQGISVEDVMTENREQLAMEGLYIKQEQGGHVTGRYKWIRPSFLEQLLATGKHWKKSPWVPNICPARPWG
jgi:hypothetical protein